MTVTRAKIEVTIPRKRRGDCSQHEKGLTKFYEQCVQALLRHVNFDVVKAVIVASPGFVRQQFFDYMYQQVHNRNNACCVMLLVKCHFYLYPTLHNSQAVKTDNKLLFENKSKFLLVHSSSGFKHSLKEVRIPDTRYQIMTMCKCQCEVIILGSSRPSRSVKAGRHEGQ